MLSLGPGVRYDEGRTSVLCMYVKGLLELENTATIASEFSVGEEFWQL